MIKIIKVGGGILKNEEKYWNILRYIFGCSKKDKIILVVSAIGRNKDPYSTDGLNNSINGALTIRERDRLKAIGETYATLKVTADLRKIRLKTKSFSYRELGLIIEENKYKFKKKLIKNSLKEYDVLVVPGYIGRRKDGEVATLKREGSDFTAVIVAKALRRREIFLVKDMPGIYDYDGGIHCELSYEDFINITKGFSSPIGMECIYFAKKYNLIITCLNTDGIVVSRIHE